MADPQAQAIASALAQIESTVQNVQRIQMTVADAQSLAHKIDTQLQTGGHDAIGDMSPEQLYDFMVSAATANTNVTLPAQPDAVREITENMITKSGKVLTTELHLPDEHSVTQSIRDGLTLSQHAPLSSLTMNAALTVLADAALPAIQKFRPGYTLDPTTKIQITKEVLGSVRTNVSITVANEIAPPSARIKGGYTVHARGPGGPTS